MANKVVHCKKSPYDVYIGRPSKWGNPFSHKQGTLAQFKVNSRTEAITEYEQWIKFGDGQHLLNDLHELKDKVLGCWCKPEPCHGDVLAKLAELDFKLKLSRIVNDNLRDRSPKQKPE